MILLRSFNFVRHLPRIYIQFSRVVGGLAGGTHLIWTIPSCWDHILSFLSNWICTSVSVRCWVEPLSCPLTSSSAQDLKYWWSSLKWSFIKNEMLNNYNPSQLRVDREAYLVYRFLLYIIEMFVILLIRCYFHPDDSTPWLALTVDHNSSSELCKRRPGRASG